MAMIKFYTTTKAVFDALETKNNSALYFITDTNEIYKGSVSYGGGKFEVVTEFPEAGGSAPMYYINSTTGLAKYWTGAAFVEVSKPVAAIVDGGSETEIASTKAVVDFVSTYVAEASENALRHAAIESNTIKFYSVTSDAVTEETTPACTVDIPVDMYLDINKTIFVNEFAWTEEAYPGSTDPSLEGKPVLVLAMNDEVDTTYSFLDMTYLKDVVAISEEEDNVLTLDENGKLYVAATDISGKADKLAAESAVAGQVLVDDGAGNLSGSGKTVGSATLAETPDENTLATEAAVKAAMDAAVTAATPVWETITGETTEG